MFSAVVFHDDARKRGIKPILGCEVYVAPGSRLDKSGTPGETATTWCCSPKRDEGFKNLIKLVSSGYTEGFYYKPRIDKELLAQHARGLIGLSSCLKGEVASEIRADQAAERAPRPRRRSATSSARTTSSSRCSTRASRSSASSTAVWRRSPATSACRSCAPTTCTTCVMATTSRTTSCCASARARSVNDEHRLRYHGDQFFLKTGGEMAAGLRRLPGGAREHAAHRRALQRQIPSGRESPAELRRARRLHARRATSSTSRARASPSAWRGCAQLEAEGTLRHTIADYEQRLDLRDRDDQADGYPGYFLIVWDFIRYAREQGIPGRARAAARRPAAWSRTACGSPTSIRSTTT